MSSQVSLFGGSSGSEVPKPRVDPVEPFNEIEKLHFEKEVVGVYISGHPLDNFTFEMDTFCSAPINSLNNILGSEGREYKLGGIVSSVEHKMTKTGRPFGKMVMEDYSGKFEFVMWSDDYLKFKSFLMPGLFLFVEGNVLRKTWGEQNLEFKIRNIELLNEIGVKRTKGLQVKVNSSALNPDLAKQLETLFTEYGGGTPLYLKLKDEKENISVELLSRKFRVRPVNEMVKRMKRIPEVEVEVVY